LLPEYFLKRHYLPGLAAHDTLPQIGPPTPAAVLAERDQRLGLIHSSPTQALCGDPLPGYSALDRRSIVR
jgi:hypothetical protein